MTSIARMWGRGGKKRKLVESGECLKMADELTQGQERRKKTLFCYFVPNNNMARKNNKARNVSIKSKRTKILKA